MTLKDILISGKLTISEGGGGGGDVDGIVDRSYTGALTLNTATNFGYGCFADMETSIDITATVATEIKERAFWYSKNLSRLYAPEVTKIGNSSFQYCGVNTGLSDTVIVLPKLATISSRANFDRGNFKAIDLGPNLSALSPDCFYHNTGLQTVNALILRKSDAVVTTPSTNAINGLRDVYVPSSLISSYEAAANWAEQVTGGYITFHAIEGSIYENAYADGTPIA